VWFAIEGNESGVWYWAPEHLADLVGSTQVRTVKATFMFHVVFARQVTLAMDPPPLNRISSQDPSGVPVLTQVHASINEDVHDGVAGGFQCCCNVCMDRRG
jgi:hypothetical protein